MLGEAEVMVGDYMYVKLTRNGILNVLSHDDGFRYGSVRVKPPADFNATSGPLRAGKQVTNERFVEVKQLKPSVCSVTVLDFENGNSPCSRVDNESVGLRPPRGAVLVSEVKPRTTNIKKVEATLQKLLALLFIDDPPLVLPAPRRVA